MTSMRRRYVASTSLRRDVPAGNFGFLAPSNILTPPPAPNILNLHTPMELTPTLTRMARLLRLFKKSPYMKVPFATLRIQLNPFTIKMWILKIIVQSIDAKLTLGCPVFHCFFPVRVWNWDTQRAVKPQNLN